MLSPGAGVDKDCLLMLEYHSVRTGIEPPARMQWEIQPSVSSDDRNQMENNLHIFRLNEVHDFHI